MVVTPSTAGGIIITEIMMDPASVPDTGGEWFEIHNTGPVSVDINGWTIRDDRSDFHLIANGGPLLVAPGAFFVMGRNGDSAHNGGYKPDFIYTGINLSNGSDEVELRNAANQVVDRVAYKAGPSWPHKAGASMQLQNLSLDNNVGANWAFAPNRGGSYNTSATDTGTPGK
jgi:hypothetical protein